MKEMKATEHKSNICRPCASKQDNQQNRVMAEINSSMYKYSWSNLCNIFFKGRQKPSLWIFKETPQFSWNSKVCDEWVETSSRTVCTKKSVMLFLLTCFQHKSFHLGVRSHTRLSYEMFLKELQSIFTRKQRMASLFLCRPITIQITGTLFLSLCPGVSSSVTVSFSSLGYPGGTKVMRA